MKQKIRREIIELDRIDLIDCNIDILRSAIAGSSELSKMIGAEVIEPWSEFGSRIFQFVINKLEENKREQGWWLYLPVHKRDNRLIGSGGYKGSPSDKEMVEIGYEITPDYRDRGLATEMAKGLIENAFMDDRVKKVWAHTLSDFSHSTSVLSRCGFTKIGDIEDSEDGLIWRWELKKQDFEQKKTIENT